MQIDIHEESLASAAVSTMVSTLIRAMDALYPEDETGKPSAAAEFLPPSGLFLAARLDGDLVGCGGLRRWNADTAEIKRMYVEPWARGRGIARRLLTALEGAAKARGYRWIRLETGTRQVEAVRLYQTSGYTPLEPYGEFKESPFSLCFEKHLPG